MKLKVKMLQSLAGPRFMFPAGSVQEIEAGEAQRLISAGIAEAVAEIETAAAAPPVRRRRRKPKPKPE